MARVLGTPGPWLRVWLDPGGFPGGSLRTGPLSSASALLVGARSPQLSAELHSHVVLDLSPRKQLPGTRSAHARPGERAPASLGVGLPILKGPRAPRSTSVPESPDSGRGRCREEGFRAETGAGAPAPGGIAVTRPRCEPVARGSGRLLLLPKVAELRRDRVRVQAHPWCARCWCVGPAIGAGVLGCWHWGCSPPGLTD